MRFTNSNRWRVDNSNSLVMFSFPGKSSLFPTKGNGSFTFTRATIAYQEDFENKLNQCLSGEIRFAGTRRVRNLYTFSQELDNAAWTKANGTITPNARIAPDGSLTMDLFTEANDVAQTHQISRAGTTYVTGQSFIVSGFYFPNGRTRFRVGTDSTPFGTIQAINFDCSALTATPILGTSTGSIAIQPDGSYRWSVILIPTTTSGTNNFHTFALMSGASVSYNGDGVSGGYLWGHMLQDATGQSVKTVSEYVSTNVLSTPYHGANVDGVKNFETTLAGVPIADSLLKGSRREYAATQLIAVTNSIRDMTDAAWTKGATLTVAKTATGQDGLPNSCCLLTGGAVAATNTLTLSLVAAATNRTYGCKVMRISGSGAVRLSQDNFGASTDISGSLVLNQWVKVNYAANQLNPVYGVRVDTLGDQIIVDWNNFTAGGLENYSEIDTGGATRNADVLTQPSAGNIDFTQGTMYAEISTDWATADVSHDGAGTGGSAREFLFNATSAATSCVSFDGTTSVTKAGLTSLATGIRKRACSWGAGGQFITGDGAAPATAVFDGTMGAGATMGVGNNVIAGQLNGYIRNFTIYAPQMDTQALTA